jgi:hypothetical protein
MIFAAAGTFLVQRWDEVGDVSRYLALLGTTLLLPAVAYVCGIRFQEGRSARVLLVTLLALITIHAGVLGGFVLSQFGTDAITIAPVARWVAPSPGAAIALVAGAAIALLPMMWAAFRVLARQHATWLTVAGAASHALLLIPDRSALAATLTIAPIAAGATWSATRLKPRALEPWLATASVAAPALIIAVRQVLFYEVTNALWGVLLAAAAGALFVFGRKTGDATIERFTILPALLSIAAFVEAAANPWASPSTMWMAYGVISAAVLLGFAGVSTKCRGFFVQAAVALNAAIATGVLVLDPRPWAALQAIAIGLGLSSVGFITGRRASLYGGISLAGLGFITQVAHAIDVFQPSGWLALATFGLGLVGLTGWLERRARSVRPASRPAEPTAKVSMETPATVSQ